MDENVKQHSHVIQQSKLENNSLKQQNEILEKEVRSTSCLLEIKDKSIHERRVENAKLSNQVEELSKTIVKLQKASANVVKREFESLHTESVNKYKVIEEKRSELLKEKEEPAKTSNSLPRKINSLIDKKSSLSRDLKGATKRHEDFPEKCIQGQHPTIAQGKTSELVDTANPMDVHKNPKPTIVNRKQNRNNVNEKPKPSDANERQSMQQKRNLNGPHQSKAQKKPQFKF